MGVHHIAFAEPGLEHRLQPTQSGTSLTSLGWSNYSVITSGPIYRGSQTKAFLCSPIFLVPQLDFFIPCSVGCILCLPKTHLYNSSLHTCYKRVRYHTAVFSYPASQTETDLYHRAAAKGAHIPQKGGEEGAALGSPQLPMAPHLTPGKGHSTSPDLSAISCPGHAAGPATRHNPACSPLQAQDAD